MSETYEKLGSFYLGKTYDFEAGEHTEDLLLYDSKDLTTHGVCFGMTGSGKTGLCTVLLEEALIDGIPVIAIDPKGDLGNLLLNFPKFQAKNYEPWIEESVAKRKGQTVPEYAKGQAALWKKGLASWGQTGERLQRLQDACEMTIYTPGSEAGIPVSMLKSFQAPSEELRADREQMRERVAAASASLLGLLGIDVDPVQSREHILISLLLDKAWSEGRNLSLADVIAQIQAPPVERVGVFDLESFYPSKERMTLAMSLNNLLASPGFEAWLAGDALDLSKMLYADDGKPRLSIFSIAHLNDAERMFFVSSLLNETLSWMRRQSGTSSLRALLYMDEIYGYLPPTANPPSKQPLMTLMKQARAFGLGALLATQNPKDLDYKALSNAGTWFIGRLQTDRDRDRVLDGLEGAAAGAGTDFNRKEMESRISSLGKRVFQLYNIHERAPEAFQTRWAMSYLSGPLTRAQIERLMRDRKVAREAAKPVSAVAAQAESKPVAEQRPQVPADVPQYFAPVRTIGPADAKLVWEPALVGSARILFSDARKKIDETRELFEMTPVEDDATPVDWEAAETVDLSPDDLETEPRQDGEWGELPKQAHKTKSYTTWSRRFKSKLYANERLELYKCAALKAVSEAGEDERDFRIRLEDLAREKRDLLKEKLRKKYEPKIARMEDRVRKGEQKVAKEKQQAGSHTMSSVLSVGSSILGAVFGRKVLSATNVRKLGTAARSVGRAGEQRADVGRAEADLESLRQQLADLEAEFVAEVDAAEDAINPLTEELDTVQIRPKKTNIDVRLLALCWMPYWRSAKGGLTAAWE